MHFNILSCFASLIHLMTYSAKHITLAKGQTYWLFWKNSKILSQVTGPWSNKALNHRFNYPAGLCP